MADYEPSIFYPPRIDDLTQLSGKIVQVCGVSTWADEGDDGEDVTILMITLREVDNLQIVEDVPEVFREAFKE